MPTAGASSTCTMGLGLWRGEGTDKVPDDVGCLWGLRQDIQPLCASVSFSCKRVKVIISLSHMIGGRNKELTYVKCLAQCLELSGNSIFLN